MSERKEVSLPSDMTRILMQSAKTISASLIPSGNGSVTSPSASSILAEDSPDDIFSSASDARDDGELGLGVPLKPRTHRDILDGSSPLAMLEPPDMGSKCRSLFHSRAGRGGARGLSFCVSMAM